MACVPVQGCLLQSLYFKTECIVRVRWGCPIPEACPNVAVKCDLVSSSHTTLHPRLVGVMVHSSGPLHLVNMGKYRTVMLCLLGIPLRWSSVVHHMGWTNENATAKCKRWKAEVILWIFGTLFSSCLSHVQVKCYNSSVGTLNNCEPTSGHLFVRFVKFQEEMQVHQDFEVLKRAAVFVSWEFMLWDHSCSVCFLWFCIIPM